MSKPSKQKPASAQMASPLAKDYILTGAKATLLQAALIASVTLWVFSPALWGDWLWDDTMYLSQNSLLSEPDRLW
jgi:hypothetical protein